MPWSEAWRLFNILAMDPSSQIGAALAGWQHPAERTDLVLRDLFDLQFRKVKKNPKAYPRPWDRVKTRVLGAGGGMSIADFKTAIGPQIEEEATDG